MRMPSHTALCSFLFSTILTSAFVPSNGDVTLASAGAPAVQMALQGALNVTRGQVFAGVAEVALPLPASTPAAAPAAAAPSSGSPLSPELLSKLLRLVATRGDDREVGPAFANTLGLTPAGQAWPDRQFAADSGDEVPHAFANSRGSDQGLVFYVRRGNTAYMFYVRRDGKAVSALIYDRQAGTITPRAPQDAQKDLDAEFEYWAKSVDKLLAGA